MEKKKNKIEEENYDALIGPNKHITFESGISLQQIFSVTEKFQTKIRTNSDGTHKKIIRIVSELFFTACRVNTEHGVL